MPRRNPGVISRVLSQVSTGVQSVEEHREPHAQFWDEWNQAAAAQTGPLWVALGDSTSQGIGADDPNDVWVARVFRWLQAEHDPNWRLINLSITGAQFSDIIEYQLPRLAAFTGDETPQLVSLLAGANNLLAPGTWPTVLDDLRKILHTIPERSVVARVGVGSPLNSVMARRINREMEAIGAERDFKLFWPWAWPSRDGLGADKWHPGSIGYGYMADLIKPCVEESLGLV